MATINEIEFNEMPQSCGQCDALMRGKQDPGGFCILFRVQKSVNANVPKRCRTLIAKALLLDTDCVLVIKQKNL